MKAFKVSCLLVLACLYDLVACCKARRKHFVTKLPNDLNVGSISRGISQEVRQVRKFVGSRKEPARAEGIDHVSKTIISALEHMTRGHVATNEQLNIMKNHITSMENENDVLRKEVRELKVTLLATEKKTNELAKSIEELKAKNSGMLDVVVEKAKQSIGVMRQNLQAIINNTKNSVTTTARYLKGQIDKMEQRLKDMREEFFDSVKRFFPSNFLKMIEALLSLCLMLVMHILFVDHIIRSYSRRPSLITCRIVWSFVKFIVDIFLLTLGYVFCKSIRRQNVTKSRMLLVVCINLVFIISLQTRFAQLLISLLWSLIVGLVMAHLIVTFSWLLQTDLPTWSPIGLLDLFVIFASVLFGYVQSPIDAFIMLYVFTFVVGGCVGVVAKFPTPVTIIVVMMTLLIYLYA